MLSPSQIDVLKAREEMDWLTELKSGAMRRLVDDRLIQLNLFGEVNLYESTHEDIPGERLAV